MANGLSAKQLVELLSAMAALTIAAISIFGLVKGMQTGLVRYGYVAPQPFAVSDFSAVSDTLVQDILSLKTRGISSEKLRLQLDSIQEQCAESLEDTISIGCLILCAEKHGDMENVTVTLEYNHKDIRIWRFLPPREFEMDPNDLARVSGGVLIFKVKTIRFGNPVAVTIVHNGVTQSPDSIGFNPSSSRIVAMCDDPPWWLMWSKVTALFVLGFLVARFLRNWLSKAELRLVKRLEKKLRHKKTVKKTAEAMR